MTGWGKMQTRTLVLTLLEVDWRQIGVTPEMSGAEAETVLETWVQVQLGAEDDKRWEQVR